MAKRYCRIFQGVFPLASVLTLLKCNRHNSRKVMKKKFKILLSVVLVFILLSCDENGSINQQLEPRADEVWIKNAKFVPNIRKVTEGTVVTWTNLDNGVHSITSLDRLFDVEIGNRERFSFTFSDRGTFQYTSRKYPDMDGLIIVE